LEKKKPKEEKKKEKTASWSVRKTTPPLLAGKGRGIFPSEWERTQPEKKRKRGPSEKNKTCGTSSGGNR